MTRTHNRLQGLWYLPQNKRIYRRDLPFEAEKGCAAAERDGGCFILFWLAVCFHACLLFFLSFPIKAVPALLHSAYALLDVCPSRVALIVAEQAFYTCAYLYWMLQWALGTGWRIISPLSGKCSLFFSSFCHTQTYTKMRLWLWKGQPNNQITLNPHTPSPRCALKPTACVSSLFFFMCNWKISFYPWSWKCWILLFRARLYWFTFPLFSNWSRPHWPCFDIIRLKCNFSCFFFSKIQTEFHIIHLNYYVCRMIYYW